MLKYFFNIIVKLSNYVYVVGKFIVDGSLIKKIGKFSSVLFSSEQEDRKKLEEDLRIFEEFIEKMSKDENKVEDIFCDEVKMEDDSFVDFNSEEFKKLKKNIIAKIYVMDKKKGGGLPGGYAHANVDQNGRTVLRGNTIEEMIQYITLEDIMRPIPPWRPGTFGYRRATDRFSRYAEYVATMMALEEDPIYRVSEVKKYWYSLGSYYDYTNKETYYYYFNKDLILFLRRLRRKDMVKMRKRFWPLYYKACLNGALSNIKLKKRMKNLYLFSRQVRIMKRYLNKKNLNRNILRSRVLDKKLLNFRRSGLLGARDFIQGMVPVKPIKVEPSILWSSTNWDRFCADYPVVLKIQNYIISLLSQPMPTHKKVISEPGFRLHRFSKKLKSTRSKFALGPTKWHRYSLLSKKWKRYYNFSQINVEHLNNLVAQRFFWKKLRRNLHYTNNFVKYYKSFYKLKRYYRRLLILSKSKSMELDDVVIRLFNSLRRRYDRELIKRTYNVIRRYVRFKVRYALKRRTNQLRFNKFLEKAVNSFFRESNRERKKKTLFVKSKLGGEFFGDEKFFKEFFSYIRGFWKKFNLSNFFFRLKEFFFFYIWRFVGFLKHFFFGINYSLLFFSWDDPGSLLIFFAISIVYYFCVLVLLKNVIVRSNSSDSFGVFIKNQMYYDYNKGGLVFFLLLFLFLVLFSFYLYLFFYQVFIWLLWVPDNGAVNILFVYYLMYYLTFCNTLLTWFFFTNLRPYYFSGAHKLYWFFNFLTICILIVWGFSIFNYFCFLVVLMIFFTPKPGYQSVDSQESTDKGFDVLIDLKEIKKNNNVSSVSKIVTFINKFRRK